MTSWENQQCSENIISVDGESPLTMQFVATKCAECNMCHTPNHGFTCRPIIVSRIRPPETFRAETSFRGTGGAVSRALFMIDRYARPIAAAEVG